MQASKHCGSNIRKFEVGENVNTSDYRNNCQKCAQRRIHSRTGPLLYKVDINGTLWRRHTDQLVHTSETQKESVPSKISGDTITLPFMLPTVLRNICFYSLDSLTYPMF